MAAATRPTPQGIASVGSASAAQGPGALIALEGIDGSGKSTLAPRLHERLRARGRDAVLTREPTDSWRGDAVRRSIREPSDPFVDAFLFLADHAAHVAQVKAWLEEGKVVVSDRYGDSCLAYQAAALEQRLAPRNIAALDWLLAAQAPVTRRPDLVLLCDLTPEAALRRIQARPELVKFEQRDFLAHVRRNYLDLAKRMPHYEVLDASGSADALFDQAWGALTRRGLASH